jgi:hypothetical protein
MKPLIIQGPMSHSNLAPELHGTSFQRDNMIVTSDIALTGTRDGKIVKFRSGETVWCPPRIDHWQGATPDTPMTHLVITGVLDGKNVFWKEKVTDEQYLGK